MVVRAKAQTGTLSFSLTVEKSFAPGMASSRANAQVQRLAATVMEIEL